MRICSLLPSATEILFAIGLGDHVVAVTHECDFPYGATRKPAITRSILDSQHLESNELHSLISGLVHHGRSIYSLNEGILEELAPDLIVTQELCEVCAVSYDQVQTAAKHLHKQTKIVSLEPSTLGDILETILLLGEMTGHQRKAGTVVDGLRARIEKVSQKAGASAVRPRVFCMEWLDPPFVAGHWVTQMVELAGGQDGLHKIGAPSTIIGWEEIRAYAPDIIVLMPCGFNVEQNIAALERIRFPPEWHQLPAVVKKQVFAVDGSSYFNRPGPRIVDGLEILAQIIHPELFHRTAPDSALRQLR